MKYILTRVVILFSFFLSLNGIKSYGQQPAAPVSSALSSTPNYTTFTVTGKSALQEATSANRGYEHHPELGVLYAAAPCKDCYELIGNRTENTKTFIKAGSNGRDIMQQTASGPLHYKAANGAWLTIKSRLQPDNTRKGVYAATEQEAPVEINTTAKFSALGKAGQTIQFNRNLELVYVTPDGSQQVLGGADYSHYTAGDDGVYITNAWPGIDIEMLVVRGAIKTNFLINHAIPAYAGGSLLVRDHMLLPKGLYLNLHEENRTKHIGGMDIRKSDGTHVYEISAAVAFEKAAGRSTLKMLQYLVTGNDVDIVVPGNFLNRPESAYPVVIDPLVSFATTSAVTGSRYSASWTSGCAYSNTATVPAKVTVTDVQFTFQYIASGGALTNNGAYDFKLGTCRSPAPTSLFWNCSSGLPGTCDAVGATIFAGQIAPCIPAPQCTSYDLNLVMNFYQNYASAPGCSPTYIGAGTPLTITVFGRTIESSTITATSSSVCAGQPTTLTANSLYGVPPYTYSWSPGGAVGNTVTVSPLTTTTYTVTSTDACGNVTSATKTINVNSVSPITGMTTVCAGGSTTLTCLPFGGAWSSSNPAIATVGATSGVVTGSGLGTATITYTTGAGCTATTAVTVTVPVAPITGYLVVCQASTTTLSNATTGGSWSSSAPSIGAVGATSGIATGVSGGLATITYATYGAGCYSTATLTVNPLAAITGSMSICVGGTSSLSNAVPGGTWSSSNVAVATINSTTGFVNGMSAGTAGITYTTPAGCVATTSMVVNLLSPITGTATLCQGSTTTLSNTASGGTWTSGNLSVATIGSATGVVSGVSGGTALITYTTPSGCFSSVNVTVNPLSAIAGVTTVCTGGTTLLSNAGGPGTWTSSAPAVATIGASSGLVTGLTVGTSNITYTSAAGCVATTSVNVSLPSPITGIPVVCQGDVTTLGSSTTGGTWATANPSIAGVGATSGIVSGVSGGIATISYTTPAGCTVTTPVTVNPAPPIAGATTLCVGNSTTLSNTVSGGSWSSAVPSVATIVPTSGLVTGVSTGVSAITYTTPAGCLSTVTVVVNVPAPITGATSVCQGNTTTLSNATAGGTWTSSNPAIAAIGASSGIVAGASGGTVTINYTTSGGCNATTSFTVNPVSPITGTATMCAGNSVTLLNATPGGTWSSVNPAVATVGMSTGIVTGASTGTTTIEYTTGAGCIASATAIVNASPTPITGGTLVCTNTTLSNGVGGGLWTSSNPSIATIVPSTGFVTGIGPGMVTITYTLPGGCFTTTTLTVNPLAPISGVPNVCQGSTTTLSYPQPGGTWASLNPAVASVDATTGVVTGVVPGTVIVRYTTTTGCFATINVTVYPLQPVTGVPTVCQGNTTTLSDATPGGTWSSTASSIAPVGAGTGVVTGLSAGTATINYTTSAGCVASVVVTVNPLSPIVGPAAICAGSTASLSDATPGGTWSSTAPSVAGVSLTGVATGLTPGTATISYTTPAGCVANLLFTVNAMPSPITGGLVVCQGAATTLSNALPGGSWISGSTGIAAIGASSGIATGISGGSAAITYMMPAGCFVTTAVSVNPLSATTGVPAVCVGGTTNLNNATPGGGTWSSVTPSIAAIDPTSGLVAGISAGMVVMQFTSSLGCIANYNVTVNPLPAAIGGIPNVCVGSTTLLTNTLAGGTWSTGDPAIAAIGVSSGVTTGVSQGLVTITYTSSAGCTGTIMVTVNPLPLPITGIAAICQGETSTLSDATPGGTWSSATPSVATVGVTSGVVSGLAPGSALIQYTTPEGCFVTLPFVVNVVPPAITGTAVVCEGATTTLFNTLAGGTWNSSNVGVASVVSATGVVTGVTAGTATITYITSFGCFAVRNVVVNPTPVINSSAFTNPTTCITSDGTISLTGLVPGQSYTVNYTGSTPATVAITADGTGRVKITGLAAGAYSNFTVTNGFGCTSNVIAGPVVLTLPPAPPAPVAGNNAPICEGVALQLTATNTVPGVTYSWSGPAGFSSVIQNPVISPSSMAMAGTYTVTATILGCVSAPATTTVVIHPIPVITRFNATNPHTCQGTDGTVTLEGLATGVTYVVNYMYSGAAKSATLVADGAGRVVITGLSAGKYTDFNVSSFTCLSNTVGPVLLVDPNPPPVPELFSNSPICTGKTLELQAISPITALTYEWTGPNGFTSDLKNPELPGITMADSGMYTLTIRHLNCPTTATINIVVYPPVELINVSADQLIPFGSSITLNAEGARFYVWTPRNGTLNNTNINNPVATPEEKTVYTVIGMNVWGCTDSADVTIDIDRIIAEGVPGAFTPNNDGLNDVFKIENVKYDKLVDFSIFNRWGQVIYHNTSDAQQGWDGTFNGVPQDMGVYNYNIILSDPNGKLKNFKGSVTLIR